ncbi:MAG: MotA/TolQ/ExbB proton channel family protein [Deltaproteobacteria bacterium]|nr:MotA/TolQ/ExbB proton channel family protein [Deltaproteobacteria bacterium]
MNTVFSDSSSLWAMIASSGPAMKFVYLALLGFSVFSWAIIGYKLILLRRVEKEGAAFLDIFWDKRQFSQINAAAKSFKHTPFAGLFIAVHDEIAGQARPAGGALEGAVHEFSISREDLERIQRVLRKTEAAEASKLEYSVPFLATAGNTAPLLGLFGTVWGIMELFRGIGTKGAASLAVVAPGISDALVTTVVGLIVAIPATIGYNYIMARIDRVTLEMSGFSVDLLNIIEKQAAKRPAGRRDGDGSQD